MMIRVRIDRVVIDGDGSLSEWRLNVERQLRNAITAALKRHSARPAPPQAGRFPRATIDLPANAGVASLGRALGVLLVEHAWPACGGRAMRDAYAARTTSPAASNRRRGG